MATHVKVLAVIALVLGALGLIGALIVSLIFGSVGAAIGVSDIPSDEKAIPLAVLGLWSVAITIYLVVKSLLAIVCGFGLLKRRRWARILSIIYAAISLIEFPIGTLAGAYALWVLFNKETEAMFRT